MTQECSNCTFQSSSRVPKGGIFFCRSSITPSVTEQRGKKLESENGKSSGEEKDMKKKREEEQEGKDCSRAALTFTAFSV